MSITTIAPPAAGRKRVKGKKKVRPTWEMANLYPLQGQWTEDEYIKLTDDPVRVEFVDGYVEFLEMPTIAHDRLVKYLFLILDAFVNKAKLGEVFISTTKTKLRELEIRMPDVFWVSNERLDRHTDDYFYGADLIVEVVSQDAKSRKRDLVDKRSSYADAGITEYWIVDPKLESITVLKLSGNTYAVHGEFKQGQKATSVVLAGFEVDVSEALAGRQ
ncbi:MAG: Uma2 family endonuclease [Planctomycetota bacterium]